MRNILSAAALGAAMLSGGVAIAQPAPPPPPPGADRPGPPPGGPAGRAGPGGPAGKMMRADRDGDGVITKDEMLAMATRKFDRMDANHDGRLDASEMAPRGERGPRPPRGDAPPPPPPPGDDGE